MRTAAAIVGGALAGGGLVGAYAYYLSLKWRRSAVAKRLRNFRSTLCLVTYNILADGMYAAVGEYKDSTHGGFNDYSTPQEREWERRFPAIMSELDACAADVICLQEIQHRHYVDSFQPSFQERGYTTTLSARGTGESDLCVMIATRDSALKVLAVEVVSFPRELAALAEEVPLSAALVQEAAKKEEEVLLVRLEQLETGKQLVVATTHLWWNPTQPELKLVQAALLCRACKRVLGLWGLPSSADAPLVLCGDFNSQPRGSAVHGGAEGAYVLLTDGHVAADHPDHPATPKPPILWATEGREAPSPETPALTSAGMRLVSAYKQVGGEELPLTTITGTFRGCLDYIFTTAAGVEVVDTLQLPRPEHMPTGMPCAKCPWPSDHFAMCALVRVRGTLAAAGGQVWQDFDEVSDEV